MEIFPRGSRVTLFLPDSSYLRIPLVLEFFAKERVGCLFDKRLRDLLWNVLFALEDGAKAMATAEDGNCHRSVPAPQSAMITNKGYFFAELERVLRLL